MYTTVIQGITVTADDTLSAGEITALVNEEAALWQQRNKALGRIDIALEGEELVIKACEKSPIRRVRRITGYLSNLENFNDAKAAECNARVQHDF